MGHSLAALAAQPLGCLWQEAVSRSEVSPCSEANRPPWYEEKGSEMQGTRTFSPHGFCRGLCRSRFTEVGVSLPVFDGEPPRGRVPGLSVPGFLCKQPT